MMKHLRFIIAMMAITVFTTTFTNAQVAINNDGSAPHSSAMLDVESSSLGLLVPRMTTASRLTLAATASEGLIVFDTDLDKFYLYNGSAWEDISVGNLWNRSGTNTLLSNQADRVGIGTNFPNAALDVTQNDDPSFVMAKSNYGYAGLIIDKALQADNGYIIYRTNGVSKWFTGTIGDDNYAISTNFTSPDGKFYINGDGEIGIGTTTPERKLEISGVSYPLRLTSSSVGSLMEFNSTSTPDWAIGPWSSSFRIASSTDGFSTIQDQFAFSTTTFEPYTSASKSLGTTGKRWSNIHSIDGDFSGDVGIGTTTPARTLEVSGPWQTARITSLTQSGATLEFVSGVANDWAITTWAGNMAFLFSNNDFSSKTDEYYITTTSFYPFTSDTKTLGTSSKQWSNLYSVDGAFTGDVGIGIQSPMGQLHVHEADNSTGTIYFTSGTTNDSTRIFFGEGSDATYGMFWLYDGYQDDMEIWGKSGSNIYGPHMAIERNNGYVAIGDDEYASGYMLSVHGDVICEELRVELVADWPDYVFKKDYELMTIPELSRFIEKNGHLPDIPPAAEVENGGFEVGEMNKVVMKKLEEYSLYFIQQQEEIERLSKIVVGQQEEIEELKNNLNKIQK